VGVGVPLAEGAEEAGDVVDVTELEELLPPPHAARVVAAITAATALHERRMAVRLSARFADDIADRDKTQ